MDASGHARTVRRRPRVLRRWQPEPHLASGRRCLMTPTADTKEVGCLRPPADGWERFPQARHGAGHLVRILQVSAHRRPCSEQSRRGPYQRHTWRFCSSGTWLSTTSGALCSPCCRPVRNVSIRQLPPSSSADVLGKRSAIGTTDAADLRARFARSVATIAGRRCQLSAAQ